MPKLHELLAVDNSLKTQSTTTRNELRNTFEKKTHLFSRKQVVITPIEEGKKQTTEVQSSIQTSVAKELKWIGNFIAKELDSEYLIGMANKTAQADVILENGDIILKDIPSTVLLSLEKQLTEVRELAKAIPTLDPAKGFVQDPNEEPGISKARDVVKTRTAKGKKVITLAPAVEKHPAQVQLIDIDEPVATLEEQEWSSLITPAEKAEILDRAEDLIRAVKKARSRANDMDANTTLKIGGKLTKFIFGV